VLEQQDSYRIRTATDSGDLLEASLQLKSQDLQPTEGRFEFRNQDWVEITAVPDLPESVTTAVAPAPEPKIASPVAPATNITPSSPVATISDELRVLSALHGIGADLGDPLEVKRDSSQIVVSGVGIAPERRQQIQQALNPLANVTVRFTESDASPEPSVPEKPAATAIPQVQARIAEQMGGRARFDQIAAEALDLSDPLMARAYALRRLAEQFPVEANLNPEDLATLRRLQRDHASALRTQTLELEKILKPALKSGVSVGQASGLSSLTTEDLFQSARRVEKLLAVVFGAAPADDSAGSELPAQLLSAVTDLRAKVEAYDHLLAKTER
jgi:hypothetical protein